MVELIVLAGLAIFCAVIWGLYHIVRWPRSLIADTELMRLAVTEGGEQVDIASGPGGIKITAREGGDVAVISVGMSGVNIAAQRGPTSAQPKGFTSNLVEAKLTLAVKRGTIYFAASTPDGTEPRTMTLVRAGGQEEVDLKIPLGLWIRLDRHAEFTVSSSVAGLSVFTFGDTPFREPLKEKRGEYEATFTTENLAHDISHQIQIARG